MALKLAPVFAVHPGPWLREEIVEPQGLSVVALAEHFGVSRQSVSKLLNGRVSLSADMAIRFEKAFGLSAETLCRMQTAHDLATARKGEKKIAVKALRRVA